MRRILTNITPFIVTSAILISIAIYFISVTEKKVLHLAINQTHTPFQDIVFKYGTNLGDGLFSILIIVICLFIFNYRKTMIGLVAFLVASLLCRILKTLVFPDAMRPSALFAPSKLHFVDGVTIHSSHSFPSGHTATAFALFIFLAYVGKKKYLQILFALIAFFVGYSRVYLSQHFLQDALGGAIIGLLSFFIACIWIENSNAKWLDGFLKIGSKENKK
jgi:membrane-associated phospholipid phosphatase